jgi:mRNA-degrading endonuclease YafQ of YafQ-DinJ toxin-antitoxin module
MLDIKYSHSFLKKVSRLEDPLIEEIRDRLELLKNEKNHQQLKVHKLHGRLMGSFSFYINYKVRVIFEYSSKNEIVLEDVGGHDIY